MPYHSYLPFATFFSRHSRLLGVYSPSLPGPRNITQLPGIPFNISTSNLSGDVLDKHLTPKLGDLYTLNPPSKRTGEERWKTWSYRTRIVIYLTILGDVRAHATPPFLEGKFCVSNKAVLPRKSAPTVRSSRHCVPSEKQPCKFHIFAPTSTSIHTLTPSSPANVMIMPVLVDGNGTENRPGSHREINSGHHTVSPFAIRLPHPEPQRYRYI